MINGVVTVTESCAKVVPASAAKAITPLSIDAFSAGSYALIGKLTCMALVSGDGNLSVEASRFEVFPAEPEEGEVVWRPCLPVPRKGLTLINTSSDKYISIGIGTEVAAGEGIVLNPGGGSVTLSGNSGYGGEIWAVADGTATLAFSEW